MILMGKVSGFCQYVVEIWVMFTIIQLNLFCLAISYILIETKIKIHKNYNFACCLYKYEMWPVALNKKHRLKDFDNWV